MIRAAMPSPNRVPLGTTTAARPRPPLEPSHDDLEEQERRLGRPPVVGKVVEDPRLFLAPEGRIGEDDVDPPVLADLGQAMAQRVAGVDARRMEAVQQQVQLGEQLRRSD